MAPKRPAPAEPAPRAPRRRPAAPAETDVSAELAEIRRQQDVMAEQLKTVLTNTSEGKTLLFTLVDEWAKSRVWKIGTYLFLLAATTYPQWGPSAWKVVAIVSSVVPHG